MRTQRLGLIQTPDQLRFSYIAILHGADRVLKGEDEDEDSLSDEGVATEDSGEEDEAAGKKRKTSEEGPPPPLPPRHSDAKRALVEDDNIQDDENTKSPTVLKRTVSLSSSSPSLTPEPPPLPARDDVLPPLPARDDTPPPLPPRDKTMNTADHFLEEREGNPSVNDIPSQNEESLVTTENTLER